MQTQKIDQILDTLVTDYGPFNLLSSERAAEVANIVRIIEMREGEIFQSKPGKGHDYLFIIEGQVDVIQDGSIKNHIVPTSTKKKPIVLPPSPKVSTLVASGNTVMCIADSDMLDNLVAWDEMVHLSEDTDSTLAGQLEHVRDSLAFRRMPLECVEAAFQRLKTIRVKKGDTVLSQGKPGEAFYIMKSGKVEVLQPTLYDDEPAKMADLTVGDTFGCEALLSGKTVSETVNVLEDAEIMVLGKDDFEELVSKNLVRRINPQVAKTMMDTGTKILDVRYAEEYEAHHIPGSTLIPLHELRNRMDELDPKIQYIVYCHGGNRSAVAVLKLTQQNFDVISLDGGIRDWPFETDSLD